MSLSALCWIYLPVFGVLVDRRDLGLLQRDALVSNRQFVLIRRGCPLVAIEECLDTDLSQRLVNQSRLSILGKEGIERFDVRIDSGLECWVRRAIGGRILEQLLASRNMIFVIPLRASALGGHIEKPVRGKLPEPLRSEVGAVLNWPISRTKMGATADL